jgi:tetratricopeptide (TPR) repeat protein
MTITTTAAADVPGRLAQLYREGRYRETLEEASRLDLPADADAAGDVELAPALQLAGCAHRELHELPAAESRLLLAQRLLGTPEGRSLPAYRRGLEELGCLYERMGSYSQAEALYRRALDLYAPGREADPEGQARCLHALGYLYDLLDRRRDAGEVLRQVEELCVRELGTNHPEYARGLLAQAWAGWRVGKSLATEGKARTALKILRSAYGESHPRYAEALYRVARTLLPLAHLEETERLLNQARDIRRASLGERHPDYAATLYGLALVKLAWSQPKEAEALARRALDITRAALGETRLEVAWCLGALGNALKECWKLTEAEECLRQANVVARSALGERHLAAAELLGPLAETLLRAGRPRDAEATLRKALTLLDQAGSEASFEAIGARVHLGRFLLEHGRREETDRLAREAFQAAEALGPDDPFVMAPACLLRARTLSATGQPAAAGEAIQRAETVVKPLPGHHGLTIAVTYARMGHLLALGDPRAAIQLGQETARRVARALGESSPAHAHVLRYVALLWHQAGDFEKSEGLFEQALALFRRHYGPEHLEVADTLRGLARLHVSRNNRPATETRLRQACDIRRAVLGEQHPGYAEGLTDLAEVQHQAGNYLGADLYYRQALDVLRVNPGEDHADYALALHGRAAVLHAVGERGEAEKLLEQALEILRADAADADPRALEVHRSLALLHASASDFLRAETLLQQTLEGYERTAGPEHVALIPVLSDLGRVYEAMGDLATCGPVLDRIRAINLRAHGERSLPHAFDLVAAANWARLAGNGQAAEIQARQALAIARGLLAENHPGLVEFLRPLALVCQERKQYVEAEQLLNGTLTLTETALGPRHAYLAYRQHDLGTLCDLTGRPDEAARRFEHAANLLSVVQGEDHPDHAAACRVRGQHYRSVGKYPEAEGMLRKTLEITRRTAGEYHPAVASCLQDLAELCRAREDLAGAAGHYREALDVLRQSDTPADALHAALLHGQALIQLRQGRRPDAEQLLRAVLEMDRSADDGIPTDPLDAVPTLAQLCAAGGRDEEAADLFRKALEAKLWLTSAFCCVHHDGTPQPFWTDLNDLCEMLSTLVGRAPVSDATARFLFDAVLRLKGLGPRGMVVAQLEELLGRHPDLRARLETRFVLGRQTVTRATAAAGPEGPEAHGRLLARWQQQRERLEQELEPQVPELARQRRWLTLDARVVAAALEADSVLIEYVCYRPRDFVGLCTGKENPGAARYLAFVLPAGRPEDVRAVDLGEAAPIDRLAQSTGGLLASGRARAALAERVLLPLLVGHESCRHVVLAATGPLARARFAELPGGLGVTRQVTSGRELLDLPAAIDTGETKGWLRGLWKSLHGTR